MADVNQIKLPNGNTYNLTDTLGRKEAYLEWGGKNFTGSYGCIDAAMVSDLNANRFSFLKKAGITIEYTRNGGTTWTDYAATEQSTVGLFNPGSGFAIGKADSTNKATANGTNYQLRVTINAANASIYTEIKKVIIYCSTNGSADCKCQIFGTLKPSTDYTKITDPVAISGWSGYNVIQTGFTIGNSYNGQYNNLRFLFTANGGNTTYTGLTILQILGFGGVGWTTPSTMAKLGHLYSYDGLQNVTFPAQVSATKFNGTATNADKVNNLTVQTAVPANAKFTDTTYESKAAASGGTALSLVTTGEKYTWNNKMDKTNPTGSGSFHFSTGNSSNIGSYAVAMGFDSEARGTCSSSIGTGTIAKNAYQHVIGRFNIEDPGSSNPGNVGTYAEIVGNGSGSSSRSNARTLDWHGNEVLAGGLKINGTQDVATTADILPNYWSLFSDINTSNTIKTLNVVSGRKISNFAVLFAIVIRGGGERTSTIIPVGRFTDGIWVSLTEVDSANTQRWYEIKYVDDEHVKVQCSSNATGSEVHIYGLGTNSTY